MISRIILIGRNAAFPSLSGARSDRPALPDAARPVVLPDTGRAAPSPRAVSSPSAARNWALLNERAPSYDATAERWIVPPSGSRPLVQQPREVTPDPRPEVFSCVVSRDGGFSFRAKRGAP